MRASLVISDFLLARLSQSWRVNREVRAVTFPWTLSSRSNRSTAVSRFMTPPVANIPGMLYKLGTVCTDSTAWLETPHCCEIFRRVPSWIGSSHRQTIRSGCRPSDNSVFTVCWVGFVFWVPPMMGTRQHWIRQKFSGPTWYLNIRRASKKSIDSISPTVPPNSMRQTWGCWPLPSVGSFDTLWIRPMISSVTCGIICTVLPRYSPRRSLSITVL
mmetsp:Transcript_10071/g.17787  ORF Transcript_10071/g.17787 Transcript_10071/m.17787 type:complete len:215 (-) Transcript_10071:325-969(-)